MPVLAGVCGTDPFRRMDYFLKQLESIGFSGVQNFPTVGLFDGNFRQNLEETGMGYGYDTMTEMFHFTHNVLICCLYKLLYVSQRSGWRFK